MEEKSQEQREELMRAQATPPAPPVVSSALQLQRERLERRAQERECNAAARAVQGQTPSVDFLASVGAVAAVMDDLCFRLNCDDDVESPLSLASKTSSAIGSPAITHPAAILSEHFNDGGGASGESLSVQVPPPPLESKVTTGVLAEWDRAGPLQYHCPPPSPAVKALRSTIVEDSVFGGMENAPMVAGSREWMAWVEKAHMSLFQVHSAQLGPSVSMTGSPRYSPRAHPAPSPVSKSAPTPATTPSGVAVGNTGGNINVSDSSDNEPS